MTFLALALALDVRDMAWLAGDWQMTRGDECIEERWTEPSDSGLLGMSRTVKGPRTTEFEFVRIDARADGIYLAGVPPASCV